MTFGRDTASVIVPESRVLVVNCGSSSVKCALVDPVSGRRSFSRNEPTSGAGPADVVAGILESMGETELSTVVGCGHRIVHGGARFTEPVLVDDDVRGALVAISELAPLHAPANLAGIDAARTALPGVPQVAVFDTAFHHTLPPHAYRYAVPPAWFAEDGVRRFGFHGISHRYVSERAAELLERPLTELRMVTAHLGNGCSATAVRDGLSVDTTMGFTPLEGLVMGTRSGDVDPGALAYVGARRSLGIEQLVEQLNSHSGLAALSGVGADMSSIVDAAGEGSSAAQLALEVFTYRLAKSVAALAVPLERLDALVFTGGIGENVAAVRAMVMSQLAMFGVRADDVANASHGRDTEGRISTGSGPVVLVVPTDEERMIARDTARLVDASKH